MQVSLHCEKRVLTEVITPHYALGDYTTQVPKLININADPMTQTDGLRLINQ